MFGKCEKCNCNLDPGEKCNCSDEKETRRHKTLFERGKKYVFSKLKFFERTLVPMDDIEISWPSWMDGVAVIPSNEHQGTCGAVTVFPEWCQEVEG